jgi:hypothetical protein
VSDNFSLQELIDEAQRAQAGGDHLAAMGLFGQAAELALELGMVEVANECAQQVVETVRNISALEGIEMPSSLKPGPSAEET